MKTSPILTCGSILMLVFLIACDKDRPSANPPTPSTDTIPTTITGTMNISLTYPLTTVSGSFELIISEPGGKILLDTVAQAQTTVKAALKTAASLVDVTYILGVDTLQNPNARYGIYVYKAVNPSTWTNVNMGQINLTYPTTGTTANMYCEHFPAAGFQDGEMSQTYMFGDGVNGGSGNYGENPFDSSISIRYLRHPNAYSYFVIPSIGLYKLYVPKGDNDTLDLSIMDTLADFSFTRTDPYIIDYNASNFQGIPDTNDLSKSVSFFSIYNFSPYPPSGVDLQYPRTPMQKYELGITAINPNKDVVRYYGYVAAFPPVLPFPATSSFSLGAQQSDNFSVTFTSPASTTYCQTSLWGSRAALYYWSSPDSTNSHPVSFVTNLKSKLLKGVNISDLALTSFQFFNVPGFSYATYFPYVCNPAQLQTHRIKTYTSYARNY